MPIPFPSKPKPASITWTPKNAVAQVESPFTFAKKVYAWPGQAWSVSIEMPPMSAKHLRIWQAFLVKLESGGEAFGFGPNVEKTFKGIPKLVEGVSGSILAGGWVPNTCNVLKSGDWISMGHQLHMVINDANSNARGQASVDIWPDLRPVVSKGIPIECKHPQGIFRLTGDVDLPTIGINGSSSAFTIAATQDFD